MAQWVTALAEQAQGPEFKSPEPMLNKRHGLPLTLALCDVGDRRISGSCWPPT